MGEEGPVLPLSRRVPGENRGHRPSAPVAVPQLPDALLHRVLAAVQPAPEKTASELLRPERLAPSPQRVAPKILLSPHGPGLLPDPDAVTEQIPAIPAPQRDEPASSDTVSPDVDEASAEPDCSAQPVPAAVPAENRPSATGSAPARRRALVGWHYRRIAASAVAIIAIGSLAYAAVQHGKTAAGPSRGRDAPGREVAARNLAAAWVAGQVSRAATVSCDPVMCRALVAHGIPAGDLLELRPGMAAPPRRSAVIVATAAARRELGGRLSSVYAPAMIASFGSGRERIDVRVIAGSGPAEYKSLLRADLVERKASGAELLLSGRIVVSAAARRQLSAGQVDSRLLVTFAGFAALHPIYVVAFGDPAPGASPDVSPLRSADLTEAPGPPHLASSAFVRSMLTFLRAQRAPFVASSTRTLQLAGGQTALRIEFSAPSLLGLLRGSTGQPGG